MKDKREQSVLAKFLEERLETMLAHPLNWGSAEAYEIQVLLLIEILDYDKREKYRRGITAQQSLAYRTSKYSDYLRGKDFNPNLPAFTKLGCHSLNHFLCKFREYLNAEDEPATEKDLLLRAHMKVPEGKEEREVTLRVNFGPDHVRHEIVGVPRAWLCVQVNGQYCALSGGSHHKSASKYRLCDHTKVEGIPMPAEPTCPKCKKIVDYMRQDGVR